MLTQIFRAQAKDERRKRAVIDERTGKRYTNPFKARRQDMGRYGVGIELYFELMKDLAYLLLFMSVMKFPQMGLSLVGNMLKNESGFYSTMLGNIGVVPTFSGAEPEETAEALRHRDLIMGNGSEVSHYTMYIAIFDFATVLLMTGYIIYFIRIKGARIIEFIQKENQTLALHTVYVRGGPRRLKGDQHQLYADYFRRHFCELLHTEDPKVVSCVEMIRDHDGMLRDFVRMVKLREKIEKMEVTAEKKGKHLGRKYLKMNAELERIERDREEYRQTYADADVMGAYVTFSLVEDTQKVIGMYETSSHVLTLHNQDRHLYFQGQPLRVTRAPEPDDILWENLDYPRKRRSRNVAIMYLILALVLVISFFFLSWVESLGEHEALVAEPESILMKLEFTLNPLNKEVLGVCDLTPHQEFGGKAPLEAKLTWNLGNFLKAEGTPAWAAQCKHPESIMITKSGNSVNYMSVQMSEETEVRSLSLLVAFMVQDTIQLTSFSIPKLTISSCVDVGEAELCTLARSMSFTDRDTTINLVQWVTDPEEDCAANTLKGVTHETVEALHHAFEAKMNEHRETKHHRRRLQALPDEGDSDVTEHGGGDEHGGEDHGGDGHGEHQEIPNAGWFLSCICEDARFADTEGCRELAKEHTEATVKHWGLSVLVHFMTSMLKKALRVAVFKSTFPRTRTERFVYSLIAIFVAEFVNSGFILFIISAHVFPKVPSYMSPLTGENGDFSGKWYTTTGSSILNFALIYVFYPHGLQLVTIPWNYFKAWRKGKKAEELEELINAYEQKEFKLDNRLATVISLACVVMTYSAPMPFMLVFGALGLGFAYWCDKAQILWNACKPTALRYQVVLTGCLLLQLGVICHCCIAIGAFGHPVVFPSTMFRGMENRFLNKLIADAKRGGSILSYMSVDGGAIFDKEWTSLRLHTYFYTKTSFPYFILIFILVAIFSLTVLFMRVLVHAFTSDRKRTKVVEKLYGLFIPQVKVPDVTRSYENLIPTISERGGVTSYFWGENPAYKEVFECIWSSKVHTSPVHHRHSKETSQP